MPQPTKGEAMYNQLAARPDGVGFTAATDQALKTLRAAPTRLTRVVDTYRREARGGRVGQFNDADRATQRATRALEMEQAAITQARATVERALAAVAAAYPHGVPKDSPLFERVQALKAELQTGLPRLDRGLALTVSALQSNGGDALTLEGWEPDSAAPLSESPLTPPGETPPWYAGLSGARHLDKLNQPAGDGGSTP